VLLLWVLIIQRDETIKQPLATRTKHWSSNIL